MTQKKRFVTRNESFLIYEMLKKHGIKKGDNIYEYNDGWDDVAIAKAVGNGISRWSVKTIRTQSFGIIKQVIGPRANELEKRIDELEKMVAALSNAVSKINPQVHGAYVARSPTVHPQMVNKIAGSLSDF